MEKPLTNSQTKSRVGSLDPLDQSYQLCNPADKFIANFQLTISSNILNSFDEKQCEDTMALILLSQPIKIGLTAKLNTQST